MGNNSHNPPGGINESQKAWTKPVSEVDYDIATGRRCPKCKLLLPGIRGTEKARCRHKQV